MKIYRLIQQMAILCVVFLLSSCGEDKIYDMGGTTSETVRFTAINLDVRKDSVVTSTNLPYEYSDSYDWNYTIPVYETSSYNGNDMRVEEYEISTTRKHELWGGGYNQIEITFIPSSLEEEEATFTMPDGTVYTATRQHPTMYWTPDTTLNDYFSGRAENCYIKAESHYVKDKTAYNNIGFIYLNINPRVRFNKDNGKWYFTWWMNQGYNPIPIESYVKFKAENITIGSPDESVSYNNSFTQTIVSRNETLTIPYETYSGDDGINTETLTGNDIFICGNNDIRFTFFPENGQKELRLDLPDKTEVILTGENPTFIWHLTREEVRQLGYRTKIYGYSTYIQDNLKFECRGQIDLHSMYEMWYDADTGKYYHYMWWNW